MTDISRAKLIDTPTLATNITNRPHVFRIGETALVWAEKVLAKKLLHSGMRKVKLSKYWVLVTVLKRLGDHYMVRMQNGTERRVHARQMKIAPESLELQ